MYRRWLTLSAALLLVLGVLTPGSASAAELLSNGGFETGTLSPWSCSQGSVVSSPVHSGSKALQGAATASDTAQCTQTVAVVSGSTYTLSGWVRGNYVYLGVTGGASTWTPSAASFTQLSLTFTASSSSVQIYTHGWYAQGTYYADDVSLQGAGGTGVPGVPGTPVAGTITNTSAALSWAASSGTVTGYRVYEGSTVVGTVTGTSATISGLTACTAHTYSVAAYNGSGESAKSGTVSITTTGCTTGVPGTPTNFHVTATTNTSIALAWTASTGTVTGYRLYEGGTLLSTVTGTSATVSGLAACTTHTYGVSAYNGSGESAKATVSGTTTGCTTSGSFRSPIYFMPLDNSPQDIASAMAASGAKYFNLAFVLDSGGCTPAWNGDAAHTVSADTTVTAVVNAVRANGGDVAISFGGYNGTELGATCGSASSLANAYQAVINKYNLTRIDLDYEGDDLDANTSVRFGAIKILQNNAAAAGKQLHVTATLPMTTIGFSGGGVDELNAAKAAGVTFDLVNIMAFDYGLTNAGNMVDSVKLVADAAKNQMKTIYGYDDATAYAHLGLQLMNGHTDQPSELFLQSDFTALRTYAQTNHFGWMAYWALNRDRQCDPSVPHNWADGTCSSVTQQPYDFSKIVAAYNG
ncbi:fibronectin type III domain-containing protein [Hamadaea tsunoensis]|uniref:fibronectin type III domain-containing protein n=1 Tax=Hamadaea tsunoensis TaxID=53368 RepID=UPI00041DA2FE|nr:fibronectin type III domain-containing protein [Hamadaea tsunoensis]